MTNEEIFNSIENLAVKLQDANYKKELSEILNKDAKEDNSNLHFTNECEIISYVTGAPLEIIIKMMIIRERNYDEYMKMGYSPKDIDYYFHWKVEVSDRRRKEFYRELNWFDFVLLLKNMRKEAENFVMPISIKAINELDKELYLWRAFLSKERERVEKE